MNETRIAGCLAGITGIIMAAISYKYEDNVVTDISSVVMVIATILIYI